MPYLQGIDYGPRDGTLGLSFHMSEGYDGLPQYLARHSGEDLWEWANRVNGVSCHVAITSDGTVWQMLDWTHACGNLNPDDRSGEYGYYGASHLKAVLGSHWPDPNAWTVSAELAGFRAAGPTDAQVRAAVKWGNDMKARFPTIRGAIGHHDQSPKGCPGLTANMKAIFAGVGGHGLWETDMPGLVLVDQVPATGFVRFKADGLTHCYVQTADREYFCMSAASSRKPVVGKARLETPLDANPGDRSTVWVVGGPGVQQAVALDMDVETNEATVGFAAAVNAALDHVAGPAAAVTAAIKEARP